MSLDGLEGATDDLCSCMWLLSRSIMGRRLRRAGIATYGLKSSVACPSGDC